MYDCVYLALLLFKQSVGYIILFWLCISVLNVMPHCEMRIFVKKPPQPTEFYGNYMLG